MADWIDDGDSGADIRAKLNTIPNDGAICTAQSLLRVDRTLLAAQIRSFGTVPVQLIAAPGAGFVVDLFRIVAVLRYGGVAFDGATNVKILTGNKTAWSLSNALFKKTEDSVDGTLFYGPNNALSDLDLSHYEDKAVTIYDADEADSTVGNSTVTFRIWYNIIDLSDFV